MCIQKYKLKLKQRNYWSAFRRQVRPVTGPLPRNVSAVQSNEKQGLVVSGRRFSSSNWPSENSKLYANYFNLTTISITGCFIYENLWLCCVTRFE